MYKAIWITWENQLRNKSMAAGLGAKLYVFVWRGNRLMRYTICTFKTINTLMKEKPEIVFAQNPSIFLNYLLLVLRSIFGYKLVSDAHFAGVIACNGSRVFQKILDTFNYFADLVIVTNSEHLRYIQNINGRAVVCEDPLPDLTKFWSHGEKRQKLVLYICSFDVDEPYDNAFKAAELLKDEGFTLCVSGNYNKVGINPDKYPHVEFLGYLPERDYYTKLFQANVVLDLTENENCLVCGAYEAMAAEKPLVTSDTICLKQYFTMGTVFTKHAPLDISRAIQHAYECRDVLVQDIIRWKTHLHKKEIDRINCIYTELGTV